MGFFDSLAYGWTAILPRLNFKTCSFRSIDEGEENKTQGFESEIALNEENFVLSIETSTKESLNPVPMRHRFPG
jgi:hypothetical protein